MATEVVNATTNELDGLVALLQQMIRIPSPNPPGDTRAMADFCAAYLRAAGFATQLVAPDNRAWSIVGRAGSAANGPVVVYHAHIDTVPLGQNARWTHAPFEGEIADGRIYGLGSVDDKAPLAAMLIQMTISRTREYSADRLGAEISGKPLALASALRKISAYAQRIVMPTAERNPASAPLFIVNPLSGQRMDNLFSTHPNVENRIRALEAMAGPGRDDRFNPELDPQIPIRPSPIPVVRRR